MKEYGRKAAARVGAQASGREHKRGRAPRFARSHSDSTIPYGKTQGRKERISHVLTQYPAVEDSVLSCILIIPQKQTREIRLVLSPLEDGDSA